MVLEIIWLSVLAEKPRLANSVPAAKTHSNLGEGNQNTPRKRRKENKTENERL
jgi:hypothetical protein